MAFIIENNVTISFAEYQDVVDKDQRLFQSNEGLTDDVVEPLLLRATQRILNRFRNSDWWRSYYINRSTGSYVTIADIPSLNPDLIRNREEDFTELCVYTALYEYILPSIADFGNDQNEERAKMGYYAQKAENLFGELITAGDWYDFNDDSTISAAEKSPGTFNLKRIR